MPGPAHDGRYRPTRVPGRQPADRDPGQLRPDRWAHRDPYGRGQHRPQFALEPVAFELDHFDESTHEGWSILVNGTIRPATAEESAQTEDLVIPWADGQRDTSMMIEPHQISGRRVG